MNMYVCVLVLLALPQKAITTVVGFLDLRKSQHSFVFIFERVKFFRHVPCCSAGASFLFRGFSLVTSPKTKAHTDCVLEAHTFGQLLEVDPFSPEF